MGLCAGDVHAVQVEPQLQGATLWQRSVCAEELLPVHVQTPYCRCCIKVCHFLSQAKSDSWRAEGSGTGDEEQRTKEDQTDTVHTADVTWKQEASWTPGWWCYLHVHTCSASDGLQWEMRSCISKIAVLRACPEKGCAQVVRVHDASACICAGLCVPWVSSLSPGLEAQFIFLCFPHIIWCASQLREFCLPVYLV